MNNIESWRTETERKPYQYRLTHRYVERTQQNPYGLVVTSIEHSEFMNDKGHPMGNGNDSDVTNNRSK